MNELKNLLEQLDIKDAEEKIRTLENYMEGILRWNEKVNLTAITDRMEFIQKHYIDSLMCAKSPAFTESSTVCDVGTGGGFPGVPLAVCFPEKEFILMDSLGKRVKIVNELCEEAGIDNVIAVHGRAEELARRPEYREHFDLCLSRAVANMRVLCEYCLPFVKRGGTFIAYKGVDCMQEVGEAEKAIRLLGGEQPRIEKLPQLEHSLVFIRKKENTPKTYPRKAGTPAKNPL